MIFIMMSNTKFKQTSSLCRIMFLFIIGHRFKTTYDFGFVALDVLYAYPEDSGTYMCKARNAVGEAVTTCSISVDCKYQL